VCVCVCVCVCVTVCYSLLLSLSRSPSPSPLLCTLEGRDRNGHWRPLLQLWKASKEDRYTATHSATHCNTLQHTATHCNTLQHTASSFWRPPKRASSLRALLKGPLRRPFFSKSKKASLKHPSSRTSMYDTLSHVNVWHTLARQCMTHSRTSIYKRQALKASKEGLQRGLI